MAPRRAALLAAALLCLPPLAGAQSTPWPAHPLKLIVPFPAGGTSDIMGRMVAEGLARQLKQPVVVENVAGAGGVTGTAQALKLPADGYTLILTGVGQNAVAHGLDPQVPYDSNRDLVHIGQVHAGPNVLVTHPNEPFKTFEQLLAYGKSQPGKLHYGYTPAASGHMAMELLKQTVSVCIIGGKGERVCTGMQAVGVPYKGGGPLMQDILADKVQMAFVNQDVAAPLVKEGKLRALAVTSVFRNPLFPDVPSISELGYPGFTARSWSGLSVAKGTPEPIVARLRAELATLMQSAEVKRRFTAQGFIVPDIGGPAYADFISHEIVRWGKVIKAAGIKAE